MKGAYKLKQSYQIDYDKKLPKGKFMGWTLKEIIEVNPGYLPWLKDNGLVVEWGLYKYSINSRLFNDFPIPIF